MLARLASLLMMVFAMTIASRNQAAHTYNEATAKGLEERIARDYAGLFRSFAARMRQLADQAE